MNIIEFLKVLFLGLVEGITEWLPVSSTGHMLLVDEFLRLNESEAFKEMFFIVIQLGAIMAVVLLFWDKLFPFRFGKNEKLKVQKNILSMWYKVVVACIPGAVITLAFDDFIDEHLHTPIVIALALVFYGIGFILVEKQNEKREMRVNSIDALSYKDALYIGLFQVLSIIPGTSRSGSTIIGGLILGVNRVVAAEFTFFMAVPVMLGYSGIKVLKYGMDYGLSFTSSQILILLVGCLSAFITSVFVIKFLMGYIKKHSFASFGWYRIALGALVLGYFLLVK